MNVKINAGDLEDKDFVSDILAKGNDIQEKTMALETEIRTVIESKI